MNLKHVLTLARLASALLALLLFYLSPAILLVQASAPTPPGQRGHYRAEETPPGLTAGQWQQITTQLEQQQYTPVAADQPGQFRATNPAQGWRLEFASTGLKVEPGEGDWRWGLHLQ